MASINEQGQRLQQIADKTRRAVLGAGWAAERSAVASTRVGVEVFRGMGHQAQPLPVSIGIRSALNHTTNGEQGHSLGVNGTGVVSPELGWDGHLVVIVDSRWLVDLSADQFSRPAMGIAIHHPVVLYLGPAGIEALLADGDAGARREDGVTLTYKPMPEPGPWEQFPDWCGKNDRVNAAANATIEVLQTTMDVQGLGSDEYMSCGKCRIPLYVLDHARTGQRTFLHSRTWEKHDHDPVPVQSDTIDRVLTLCDFCTDPNPTWVYAGRNINAGSVAVNARTGRITGDDGGPDNADMWMGELWYACDPCDRFINARDLDGLVASARRSKHNQRSRTGLPDEVVDSLMAGQRDIWSRFLPTIRSRRPVNPPPPPVLGPRLLPKIRSRLVRLYRDDMTGVFSDGALRATPGRVVHLPGVDVGHDDVPFYDLTYISDAQAARFTANTADSLQDAELFHVSAQFTDLALASGRDLPDFTVTAEELPCPHGLLLWQRPVSTVRHRETPEAIPAHVVGCAWRTVPGGVWISLYSQPEQHLTEVDPAVLRERFGWLLPIAPGGGLEFGVRPEFDASADEVLRAVLATWFLILQPGVADVEQQEIGDGKERRRAARAGQRLPWVKVVDLRRQHRPQREDGGPRGHWQVSVRFMVRGHWRRQAYGPGRGLRRTMYIAPFLKGPDTAPLKTEAAPTVKVLR